MGSRASSDRELLALRPNDGPLCATHGLRGHDTRTHLATDSRAGAGHLEPCTTTEKHTRVGYLAALLAGIDTLDPHGTAQKVIDRFGSLAAFAGADLAQLHEALESIPALPPALVVAQSIALAGIRERALTSRLSPHRPAFLDYLRLRLAKREAEMLVGFFVAADGSFISERTLAESEGHSLAISASAILRVAIALSAAQIVLVHNHPSGLAHPSNADRAATRELIDRAAALDIKLLDHLIVGGSQVFSMERGRVL